MKTDASSPCISCQDLQQSVSRGDCVLVDVREPVEFAEEHISGAQLIPLGELERRLAEIPRSASVVVMCRGGKRGADAQKKLLAHAYPSVVNLEGGILAWKSAGLPTECGRRPVLPLMQQVQLIIGLGVLTGSILALTVDVRFAFLSAFFGAGLTLAGSTGWCGLAILLAKMPWNNAACAPGSGSAGVTSCCATKPTTPSAS